MKLAKANLLLLALVIGILLWSQFFRKPAAETPVEPDLNTDAETTPTKAQSPKSSPITNEASRQTPRASGESSYPAADPISDTDRPDAEAINYFQNVNRVISQELEKQSFDEMQRKVIMRNLAREFNLAGNPNNPTNLERAQTESVRELKLDEERSSALGDAIMEGLKQPMETVTIPQFKSCLLTRVQNLSACTVDMVQDFLNEVAARSQNDNFWITPELNDLAQSTKVKAIGDCQESPSRADLIFELHIGTCRPL